MQGRITTYFPKRGFGFIKLQDGSERFFHISECNCPPTLGLSVEFELGQPVKEGQPQIAANITPIEVVPPNTPAERKAEGGAL